MQWNVLPVKKGTFEAIREFRPHVIFLQETRMHMQNTPAYNYESRCRDVPSRGGGVAVGIDRILTYRNLTEERVPALLLE